MFNKPSSKEGLKYLIDPRLILFKVEMPALRAINREELEEFDDYNKKTRDPRLMNGRALMKLEESDIDRVISYQFPIFHSYRKIMQRKINSSSFRFSAVLKTIDQIQNNGPEFLRRFRMEEQKELPSEIELNLQSIDDLEEKTYKYVRALRIWAEKKNMIYNFETEKFESKVERLEEQPKRYDALKLIAPIQIKEIIRKAGEILSVLPMSVANLEKALTQNMIFINNSISGKATLSIKEAMIVCIEGYEKSKYRTDRRNEASDKLQEILDLIPFWYNNHEYTLPNFKLNDNSEARRIEFLNSMQIANMISKIFKSLPMHESIFAKALEKNSFFIEALDGGESLPVRDTAKELLRRIYGRGLNSFEDRRRSIDALRFLVKSVYNEKNRNSESEEGFWASSLPSYSQAVRDIESSSTLRPEVSMFSTYSSRHRRDDSEEFLTEFESARPLMFNSQRNRFRD